MLTDMPVWVCPSKKIFKNLLVWALPGIPDVVHSTYKGTNLIKLSRDDVIELIHWELESLLSH